MITNGLRKMRCDSELVFQCGVCTCINKMRVLQADLYVLIRLRIFLEFLNDWIVAIIRIFFIFCEVLQFLLIILFVFAGVLWNGNDAIPGSLETVEKLKKLVTRFDYTLKAWIVSHLNETHNSEQCEIKTIQALYCT